MSTNIIWRYLSKLFNYPIIKAQDLYDEIFGYDWETIYPKFGIILGGIPKQKFLEDNKNSIVGIINMCDESTGYTFIDTFIDTLHLPTVDTYEPSLEYLWDAVEFIEQKLSSDESIDKFVYIHCRAGVGRSATVSVAWLCYKFRMTPFEAFKELKINDRKLTENVIQGRILPNFIMIVKILSGIEKSN